MATTIQGKLESLAEALKAGLHIDREELILLIEGAAKAIDTSRRIALQVQALNERMSSEYGAALDELRKMVDDLRDQMQ